MNLTIECESANINPNGYKGVSVEIHKADFNQLMESFTVKDVVAYFDTGDLLDTIGEDEAKKHFDLIDNTEE